ncbi:hypothetical protein [Homoserinibacter sp. YIM 151385]|uniref:hypothetical protein n=1 Tax=Homoserinibacter sp. YIM 151385 TaxID=2985506 RepID=UPI0022F0D0F2|nr:hypothetical protein [Homoserinibacter sp. YIM 151385]WBU39022.1 hypothetical protein OF852_05425 [Homoserinibacter sp. YIM 151385]
MRWVRFRRGATLLFDVLVPAVPLAAVAAAFWTDAELLGGDAAAGSMRTQALGIAAVVLLGMLAVRRLIRVGWLRRGERERMLGLAQAWCTALLALSGAWFAFGVGGIGAVEPALTGRALFQGLVGIIACLVAIGVLALRRPAPPREAASGVHG